jgi:tRNA(Ile)-lysidine synthase
LEDLANKDPFLIGKKIVVALSGGIDSVVLLHFLNSNHAGSVRAIHINHNLSQFSNDWKEFCRELCENNNIEFKSIDLNIKNSSNIEENARKSRYNSLKSDLLNSEILCTAHHQDDQAETLLLQLFRGSGVAGLASMPKLKGFGESFLYRPLLNITKQQINDYASKNHLDWIEDDSNDNTQFKRNLLRLELIPKLKSSFDSVINNISRSANHQAEALNLMRDLAKIDIEKYSLIVDNKIQVSPLLKLPSRRIVNVLRYYINQRDYLMPSNKVLTELIAVMGAKNDAQVILKWHVYEVRRYNNELYFFETDIEETKLECPFYEKLKCESNFEIRYRVEGQRVKLKGKKHSSSLKKILQDSNIPPWNRDKLRMYYINGRLIAMESIGEMSEV